MSNPYIPITEEERAQMLEKIGVKKASDLFADIPAAVAMKGKLPIADGKSEAEVERYIKALAAKNTVGTSFLGFGTYDHIIPAAVTALANNPIFVTAYTPYQPEISQGVLEAIFEYQSMVCEVTGMDVSNASLYDAASACVEAGVMALSNKRKSDTILVSPTIHPYYLETLKAWTLGTDRKIVMLDEKDNLTDFSTLESKVTETSALVLCQSPNRYGYFEDYSGIADKVHNFGMLFAVSSDPMSLALQKSQGEWGADIAVGDMQSFGMPVGFGGPYCGYMAVKSDLMRKIPGRIVGQTVDTKGQRCFVLTLQAREQHIKRERATSNICSNEALCALTAVIYASEMGWAGITEAAKQSYAKSHYLADKLGVKNNNGADFFCEFVLPFSSQKARDKFYDLALGKNIWAGVKLDDSKLLVAVTEKRTKEELDSYIALKKEVE